MAAMIFATIVNAQTTNVLVSWIASVDPNATGYNIYYRLAGTTNAYQVTNVVGAANSNLVIKGLKIYSLYEIYATTTEPTAESNPSNKIKTESVFVSAYGLSSPVYYTDNNPTNLPQFQLIVPPNITSVNGILPNLSLSALIPVYTNDLFAYKSPEIFSSQNVTSYISTYQAPFNTAPIMLPVIRN
jgi:hypothetical protein